MGIDGKIAYQAERYSRCKHDIAKNPTLFRQTLWGVEVARIYTNQEPGSLSRPTTAQSIFIPGPTPFSFFPKVLPKLLSLRKSKELTTSSKQTV